MFHMSSSQIFIVFFLGNHSSTNFCRQQMRVISLSKPLNWFMGVHFWTYDSLSGHYHTIFAIELSWYIYMYHLIYHNITIPTQIFLMIAMISLQTFASPHPNWASIEFGGDFPFTIGMQYPVKHLCTKVYSRLFIKEMHYFSGIYFNLREIKFISEMKITQFICNHTNGQKQVNIKYFF